MVVKRQMHHSLLTHLLFLVDLVHFLPMARISKMVMGSKILSLSGGVLDRIILLNNNRAVKEVIDITFPGVDDWFVASSVLFLDDFDRDREMTLAIGSASSYDNQGAVYLFELQPPYGSPLGGGGGESCDPGKFCNDLTTRCEDDPTICSWWTSACQTRYIDGCSPRCLLGCGDGVTQSSWSGWHHKQWRRRGVWWCKR